MANKIFTPEEFGAVGDGQVDDTKAIQAAINKAVAEKGQVEFGRGKCYRVALQLEEVVNGPDIR